MRAEEKRYNRSGNQIHDPYYEYDYDGRHYSCDPQQGRDGAVKGPGKRRGICLPILIVLMILAVGAAVTTAKLLRTGENAAVTAAKLLRTGDKSDMEASLPADPSSVEVPDWIQQDFLRVNEYSRPGTPLETINGIVVHYVGNPGTTAAQNRSYFDGLADSGETYASSHFVIDTDGTVIQCIPLNEIAYCSNQRNEDTISIECCHQDESGQFTEAELDSLTRLIRWLANEFRLDEEDVLRHYDVTGKDCPKYFVDHPDEWAAYLDKVFG